MEPSHLYDVGTRFRYRYVDGIMFATRLSSDEPEPTPPTRTLYDVGDYVPLHGLNKVIHIPVMAA
jgi:hypothetical protein